MTAHTAIIAHIGESLAPHDLWGAWSFEPAVLLGLALAAALYAAGVRRLWRTAGRGRGVGLLHVTSFATGWLVLVVALVSPLHALGEVLFSAHMAQHTLLVALAAPLLVLGRPLVPALWALPHAQRRPVAQLARHSALRAVWRTISAPLNATLLHALALWLWHAPAAYQAAAADPLLHALQHTSFIATALLFWHAMLHTLARGNRYGIAAAHIFVTAVHTAALGAVITVSDSLWYPSYAAAASSWGTTALQDQRLAGWIMWAPAGMVYLAAMLYLLAGWMKQAELRVARRQARLIAPLVLLALLTGCREDAEVRHRVAMSTGGNPEEGKVEIRRFGCGACHTIDGVPGASGKVGPVLDGISRRAYIAGVVQNSPQNIVSWIMNPKALSPNTAMPYLGVSEQQARDIAAYLYTLQ